MPSKQQRRREDFLTNEDLFCVSEGGVIRNRSFDYVGVNKIILKNRTIFPTHRSNSKVYRYLGIGALAQNIVSSFFSFIRYKVEKGILHLSATSLDIF